MTFRIVRLLRGACRAMLGAAIGRILGTRLVALSLLCAALAACSDGGDGASALVQPAGEAEQADSVSDAGVATNDGGSSVSSDESGGPNLESSPSTTVDAGAQQVSEIHTVEQIGPVLTSPQAGDSDAVQLSGDGRFVVFASSASGFVAGDTNAAVDIFVQDRRNLSIRRVSISSEGAQANGSSSDPSISSDGSTVAFRSVASNLVSDDNNGTADVFVHTMYVAFESRAADLVPGDTNAAIDVFLRDRSVASTTRVSRGSLQSFGDVNSDSGDPDISADGNWLVYRSVAAQSETGTDNNDVDDVYLYNVRTGTRHRLSESLDGIESDAESRSPRISDNGRYVVFTSSATTLTPSVLSGGIQQIYRVDLREDRVDLISINSNGQAGNEVSFAPVVADDGSVVFVSLATNLGRGAESGAPVLHQFDGSSNTASMITATIGGLRGAAPDVDSSGVHLAFESADPQLATVSGDLSNGLKKVFLAIGSDSVPQ